MNVHFLRVHQLFYPLFAVLFPGVCGAPIGGMPTGSKVFLDLAGHMWAAALRLEPTLKKALCRTCLLVGRRINKVHFLSINVY